MTMTTLRQDEQSWQRMRAVFPIIALIIADVQPVAAACDARANYDELRAAVNNCQRHLTPESTWIEWIEYCTPGPNGVLFVKVKSGKARECRYDAVPAETWSDFAVATSKGRFFNHEIKGRFACSRRP